jgi:hypothetical protein
MTDRFEQYRGAIEDPDQRADLMMHMREYARATREASLTSTSLDIPPLSDGLTDRSLVSWVNEGKVAVLTRQDYLEFSGFRVTGSGAATGFNNILRSLNPQGLRYFQESLVHFGWRNKYGVPEALRLNELPWLLDAVQLGEVAISGVSKHHQVVDRLLNYNLVVFAAQLDTTAAPAVAV